MTEAVCAPVPRAARPWLHFFSFRLVLHVQGRLRVPDLRLRGVPERIGAGEPELDGVPESLAKECLRLAATKLPIRTKFVSRHAHD